MQMQSNSKRLNLKQQLYIPTQEERIKIYNKISDRQQIVKGVSANADLVQSTKQIKNQRVLTKNQLQALMQRLMKDTKKQFEMKKQIEDIQTANKIKRERRDNSEKVQQRLLEKGKLLQQKKQALKVERQRQVASTLQSKPKITKKAHCLDQKPLNQRLQKVIQQKYQLSQDLFNKYKPSFKPSIDPYSQFIAEINSQNSGDFFNRLQKYKAKSSELMQQKAVKIREQQMKDVTFQPRINHRKRKTDNLVYQKNKIKREQNQVQKQQKFKPKINRHSSLMIKQKMLQNMDNDTCYDRLYKGSKAAKQRLNRKQHQQFSKYSFVPTINNKSKILIQQKLSGKPKNNAQSGLNNEQKQYEEIMVSWNGSPLIKKDTNQSVQSDSHDHLWSIDNALRHDKQAMYRNQILNLHHKSSRVASAL